MVNEIGMIIAWLLQAAFLFGIGYVIWRMISGTVGFIMAPLRQREVLEPQPRTLTVHDDGDLPVGRYREVSPGVYVKLEDNGLL